MEIQAKQHAVLLNTIIGATLASPFEGMSRGHIVSIFKEIADYTDPLPGLKGKPERWRKPGLYPCGIQLCLLISMLTGCKNQPRDYGAALLAEIAAMPDSVDYDYKIFRHPGRMERALLQRIKDGTSEILNYPTTEFLPLAIPLSFERQDFFSAISHYIKLLAVCSRDVNSITGGVLIGFIIRHFTRNGIQTDFWTDILTEIDALRHKIDERPDLVFDLGINPDTCMHALGSYREMLAAVAGKNVETGERIICATLNKNYKTPITRATINDPQAIIPYALLFCENYKDQPQNIVFQAVKEGGAVTILTTLANAVAGAIFGREALSEELAANLVNKKRVLTIIDTVINRRVTNELLDDFIQAEAGLTVKEQAELQAKLKHVTPKNKKKQTRRDKELDLTRHVVETWTKLDKARWKKEKRKLENQEES